MPILSGERVESIYLQSHTPTPLKTILTSVGEFVVLSVSVALCIEISSKLVSKDNSISKNASAMAPNASEVMNSPGYHRFGKPELL